jgi:Uma2 family endonuclease
MNVQAHSQMDKSAFLAWAQEQEGRFELVERRVVMMTGGSKWHALVASNLARELWARLDLEKWIVLGSDLAVDVGPGSLRYPDVIVDSIGGPGGELTATAPVLIAEVVSPSSATLDLGDKAAEYLCLDSLAAYLVLAQDEPKAWLWVRGPNGFPPGPNVLAGPGTVIRVASLGLDLPLSRIYLGVSPS